MGAKLDTIDGRAERIRRPQDAGNVALGPNPALRERQSKPSGSCWTTRPARCSKTDMASEADIYVLGKYKAVVGVGN